MEWLDLNHFKFERYSRDEKAVFSGVRSKAIKSPKSPKYPSLFNSRLVIPKLDLKLENLLSFSIFRNYILSSMIKIFGLILKLSDFHRFLPS